MHRRIMADDAAGSYGLIGFRDVVLFEFAPVAQLDRALDFESRGRGFESLPARHFFDRHVNWATDR